MRRSMTGPDGKRLMIAVTVPSALTRLVAPQLGAIRGAGWRVMLVSSPAPKSGFPEAVGRAEIQMTRLIYPLLDIVSLA